MGRIKPAALLRQSKKQKGPTSRPSVTAIAACIFLLVMFVISIAFINNRQKGKQVARPSEYAVSNSTKVAEVSPLVAELYSVWALAPSAHPGLQKSKEHLQRVYGGPEFEPHVTVLGDITLSSIEEGVVRLQDLARSLKPITYRIRGVGHGVTYFQSVFLTVDPTPQVLEANAQAKRVFQVAESEKNAYFPHLSLLYGDLRDEDKKRAEALAEETFSDTLVDSEFVVSTLSLWSTDTEDKLLTTWKKAAEFPLEGSSS